MAEEGEALDGLELLLRVKLDDLELHAADACLPARRLVLVDLADGIGLLPAESCSRLGHDRDLRDHGLLLLVVVDVVARGEERRRRCVLRAAVLHRRERGGMTRRRRSPRRRLRRPQFVHRRALRLRAPSDRFHFRRSAFERKTGGRSGESPPPN